MAEEIIEQLEETADEIDDVTEALAVHGIISEERHEQILEEVAECRNRLENLLTRTETLTQAESPVLSKLTEEVMEIKAELQNLKESLITLSKDLKQSNPPTTVVITEPVIAPPEPPAEPAPEELIVEPVLEEPPQPGPKPRKYKAV